MSAHERLLETLAERNEEIRRLRRDNEVLISSLQTMASMHDQDEVAQDIIGHLEVSGRGAQVRRRETAATR